MNTLSGTARGDYGHAVFQRDGFTCVYCGFDGNGFDRWRQLTVDHLKPVSAGGTDSSDNLVTACNFCAVATSWMEFTADASGDEILTQKKKHVAARLKSFYEFWEREVAPRDDALTPEQGGLYLPHRLVLSVQGLELTDEQLTTLTAENHDLQWERTAKGELVIMPPTGHYGGRQESRLHFLVAAWAERDGTGIALSASVGFRLPNGALVAPDVAWLPHEHWEASTRDDTKTFARACPDFVLELRSRSDTLTSVQRKMEEYIQSGARLGWLIDPVQKRVHIYGHDGPVEVLDNPATVSGEPVLPGFELNLREIW